MSFRLPVAVLLNYISGPVRIVLLMSPESSAKIQVVNSSRSMKPGRMAGLISGDSLGTQSVQKKLFFKKYNLILHKYEMRVLRCDHRVSRAICGWLESR